MPNQTKKGTNLKVTGTKTTKNKTRCRTREAGKEATKLSPQNRQAQLPLRDLVVVECLSKPLRGPLFLASPIFVKAISLFSPYRSLWYKRAARSLSLFLRDMATAQKYCWLWRNCVAKLRVETRIVCSVIMMC